LKEALINATAVGSGGFIGALARYGLSGLVQRQFHSTTFPVGTLTVNLLGCLLIGIVTGLADSRQVFTPEFRIFVFIGLLGGFTTFSTFGYETLAMFRDAEYLRASLNVGMHLVVGLIFVWFGYAVTSISGS